MIEYCFETTFELAQEEGVRKWIQEVVRQEGKSIQEIVYIFCEDDRLLELNKKFLNHDTYTDILTFPYPGSDSIHADIFISVPRIKENAEKFKVDEQEEVRRVMIHGVLHLLGYDDQSEEEKKAMRELEDIKLKMFHVEHKGDV